MPPISKIQNKPKCNIPQNRDQNTIIENQPAVKNWWVRKLWREGLAEGSGWSRRLMRFLAGSLIKGGIT